MKGPFERLKYDLRRIWECPQCGHKVRTDGTATTQFCRCGKSNTNPAIAMKLVGDGPRRLVPAVPKPAIAAVEPAVAEPAAAELAAETATTQIDVISVSAASVEVTTTEVETLPVSPTPDVEPRS